MASRPADQVADLLIALIYPVASWLFPTIYLTLNEFYRKKTGEKAAAEPTNT